jgi:hypothetical protein
MKEFIIATLSFHLAASKNPRYRENTVLLFRTLALFLQNNGLSVRPLLRQDMSLDPAFKLMRSDLTDEGYELIKVALDKWVGSISAGRKPPTDDSLLKKYLIKLRETNSDASPSAQQI